MSDDFLGARAFLTFAADLAAPGRRFVSFVPFVVAND